MVAVAVAGAPAESDQSVATESVTERSPCASESGSGVTDTVADAAPAGMRSEDGGAV